ncbi:stealth family protein [Streptomyces sp. NBC_01280]|uniref:stealth family protein n=1 Tax=unclassified Streptomyces TaxID=2593676 RepID=UPI002E2F62EB|nr:stealth family protein [Streptomyces sp. NBC_01280]WSE17808.1 stealth family protein [Streptomyces sp. NBC_01397]
MPVPAATRRRPHGAQPAGDRAARRPGGERRVMVDMHQRVALVHDRLTPLAARELNNLEIRRALDAAHVDWFAVPGSDDTASVLGVDARQRPQTLAALRERMSVSRGFVARPKKGMAPGDGAWAADSDKTWERAADMSVVRAFWFRTTATGALVYGADAGCDVEFWDAAESSPGSGIDRLVAPRPNRASEYVSLGHQQHVVAGEWMTRLVGRAHESHVPVLRPTRTRPELDIPYPDEPAFPIDVVYTWVDGDDPAWQRRRAESRGEVFHAEAASLARYVSRDELKYSLRSVRMFMPWVRNIYIVTDQQVPRWWADGDGRARVVDHREIFADPTHLPTFNSHAIESRLHHIPGLSRHFVYFNDDMFIGRPLAPSAFFHPNGIAKFFPSPAQVPYGAPEPDEVPTSVAAKNNRRLIAQRFGRTLVQKMKHVPYALNRDVLAAIERDFPEEHRGTSASPVRSMTDLSIASSLHHYYGYYSGCSLPGDLRYGYFALDDPELEHKLELLLRRRDRDTFCLNDSASDPAEIEHQSEVLHRFLEAFYPVPSPYEKTAG